MGKLLFVRHAAVQINPTQPANKWPLSKDGRSLARQLAPKIAAHSPSWIVASEEQKARDTGQIIAAELGVPWQTAPDLHEHDRHGAPFYDSREQFLNIVAEVFANPDELIFGNETAVQARERFDTAVHHLITAYPTDTLVIATHGTVLTLFLAHYNSFLPFPFWQNLKLPDFVIVRLPDMALFD